MRLSFRPSFFLLSSLQAHHLTTLLTQSLTSQNLPHRQEISTRHTIITLFLDRFTLAPDEAEAIASREVPVGPRFFAAMDKAERVREDCRVLMAGEDGPTKAG